MPQTKPVPARARNAQLPPPDAEANAHSLRLVAKIHDMITAAGGSLPFEQFMQAALYQPGLGYYRAGTQKFGVQGDFTTAPELSGLFADCVARFVAQTGLAEQVLEVGAGSGLLAARLLSALAMQGRLPERYFILELSAELRARQQATLAEHAAQYLDRVQWLDDLPDNFSGVVLANELLDAMPVRRFRLRNGQVFEQHVAWCDGVLCCRDVPAADVRLLDRIATLREQSSIAEATDYISEINFMAEDWLRTLGNKLDHAVVLLIDYGYPRSAYYHAQRSGGTLMCHYRHQAHPDPLILVGLQDITAHVDFTAMADATLDANLEVRGFTTQAHFLMNLGLLDMAQADVQNDYQQVKRNSEIKQLTLPNQMGEQFKVMALSKNCDAPLPGFAQHDLRHLL